MRTPFCHGQEAVTGVDRDLDHLGLFLGADDEIAAAVCQFELGLLALRLDQEGTLERAHGVVAVRGGSGMTYAWWKLQASLLQAMPADKHADIRRVIEDMAARAAANKAEDAARIAMAAGIQQVTLP